MKTQFGTTKQGIETFLYTIENDKTALSVTDYGATLVKVVYKPENIDVITGFDDVRGYQSHDAYMGASIGRTANRIAGGVFTLNKKTYQVPVNNNGNANHGGISGFDKKIWKAEEKENEIVFSYRSCDGEEGYPGNLDVKVTYRLTETGFMIEARGMSDQDTLFAYTNHAYFNLDGTDSVLSHTLKVCADTYALSDENGLAQDHPVSVKGTPFDFTVPKQIGSDIDQDNEQLHFGHGYDHFFPVSGSGMREMAVLKGKKLAMTITSSLPGIQVYTGNYLTHMKGKAGHVYDKQCAAALECSYMPNAVNYPDINEKPILRKGEEAVQTICYSFQEV